VPATATSPAPTAGAAVAFAFGIPIALKDDALRHARAFIADLQHPGDREAAELLSLIDRALGGVR
jgi:hypothetical protein